MNDSGFIEKCKWDKYDKAKGKGWEVCERFRISFKNERAKTSTEEEKAKKGVVCGASRGFFSE